MDEVSQFLAPFDLESSLQIHFFEAEELSLQLSDEEDCKKDIHSAEVKSPCLNHDDRFSKPIYQMLERIDNKLKAEEHQRKFGFDEILKDFEPSDHSLRQEDLWVDKYRPKKFTQLISMDSSNLEVLKWMKQWDTVKDRFSGDSTSSISSSNIPHKVPLLPSKSNHKVLRSSENYDPFGRPDKKILLIHGHPGLGKTTLAHIVAQTAGYSVVEINASDERSGNSVINKISSAIQVKSAFTKDLKPVMIIIDEIDGAAAAGNENNLIKYLVKIATAKASTNSKFKGAKLSEESESDSDENNSEGDNSASSSSLKVSKSKKLSNFVLIRPIICICNDLFVPALRPLRQIAHIVQIKPMSPVQLSLRLKSICDIEGLKINTRSLVDLSEIMDSDVRSSLNALQFLHKRQGSAHNTNSFTNDLTFGAFKDSVKPPMKLYENVFHSSTTSNAIQKAIMVKDSKNSTRKYSQLLELLWTSGVETDRIINGCFEIYPTVKFFDNCTMDRVNSGLELFSQFDLMSNPRNISSGSSSIEGRLDGYSLYSVAGLKDLFSTPVFNQIKYPKEDYENYLKKSELTAIFKDYMSALPSQIRSTSSKESLIFERINTIIISALEQFNSIKSSNPQLMKFDEKKKLNRTVDILFEEGIFLKQVRLTDGTSYKFVLDPPIDKLCLSSVLNDSNSKFDYFKFSNTEMVQDSHSYALCRLTASEMESHRIRNLKKKSSETMTPLSSKLSSSAEFIGVKRERAINIHPSTLEIRDSEHLKKRIARDFFGRPVNISEDQENSLSKHTHNFNSSHTNTTKSVEMNLWYVQNDGVSNAVRRNIKVGSFSSVH